MCKGTIVNCIIWGNSADYDAQLSSCGPTVYCCIILDPKFVDPDGLDQNPETYEDNDYRLAQGSPCIDAGGNDDWMWNAGDLDGNPRVWRGKSFLTVDIGAYEYNSSEFRVVEHSKAAGSCLLAWRSRPGDTYTVWSCGDLMDAVWSEEASLSSQGDLTSWTGLQPIGRIKFYRVELRWLPPGGAVDGHSR